MEMIFGYSRKQAIEDGVLVDVSEMAREAGFTFPVAITEKVWNEYIANEEEGQSTEGRLWDTLWMLRMAIRKGGGSTITYNVLYRDKRNKRDKIVRLKAVCGPGDDFEPVITIMLPNED